MCFTNLNGEQKITPLQFISRTRVFLTKRYHSRTFSIEFAGDFYPLYYVFRKIGLDLRFSWNIVSSDFNSGPETLGTDDELRADAINGDVNNHTTNETHSSSNDKHNNGSETEATDVRKME